MLTTTTDRMPALGWMPLSASARRDGFLPVFRRIKQEGRPIIDEWGFLSPDLLWRHGRGFGESRLECVYAFELLQSTCRAVVDAADQNFRSVAAIKFAKRVLEISQACDYKLEQSSICIFSPKVPDPYSRAAWLAALPRLIPACLRPLLPRLSREPALLVRVGYRMLVSEWSSYGPTRSQTAEALALFGLGALGLFPRWRCADCFRLAIPGKARCWEHGQDFYDRETFESEHIRQSSSARLGRRVVEELCWSKDDFLSSQPSDSEIERKTIAGILWGLHPSDRKSRFQELLNDLALGKYPRVWALLPDDFNSLSAPQALKSLRERLDPNEWCVSSWYTRVYAAEQWLDMAARLAPGRKHMMVAPRTLERVSIARALLAQGRTQKKTAELLGITPAYLSKLLKRNPGV